MIESHIQYPTTDPLQISWNLCGTLRIHAFTPPNNMSVFYLAVQNFFSEIFFKWIRRRYSTFHNPHPAFWEVYFWRPKYTFKCKKRQKPNKIVFLVSDLQIARIHSKSFTLYCFCILQFWMWNFDNNIISGKTGQKWSKFDFSKLEFLSRKFD